MRAPLTPPATHTANATARAHPHVISSQSPAALKITVGPAVRPEPGRAATAMATTPSPNEIRTTQPRNSDSNSPYKPVMRPTVRPSPRKGVMSDITILRPGDALVCDANEIRHALLLESQMDWFVIRRRGQAPARASTGPRPPDRSWAPSRFLAEWGRRTGS